MPISADCFSEAQELRLLEERLTRRYASVVPPEVVRQVVRAHTRRFDAATVRLFVPLLVERAATLDLDVAKSRAA
jgi:hypothetical protein